MYIESKQRTSITHDDDNEDNVDNVSHIHIALSLSLSLAQCKMLAAHSVLLLDTQMCVGCDYSLKAWKFINIH